MNGDTVREGTLTAVTVDVAEQVVILHVHLRLGGFEAEHVLRLESVSEFTVRTTVVCPWTYAALSGLRCWYEPGVRQWVLEAVLWSPEATVRVQCGVVRLDGMVVDPGADADRLPVL